MFYVSVNGQIEHAEFPGTGTSLYCTFSFVYGKDWEVVRVTGEGASIEDGMTQISERMPGPRALFVFNFPLEITFRSTNPYGWPQLVITVYNANGKKNNNIMGYGWTHVPCSPGRYENTVRMFVPRSSSVIQQLLGSMQGKKVEFIDPTFVAGGEGREVTRVKSEGVVRVRFNVMTKNMSSFGFEEPKEVKILK